VLCDEAVIHHVEETTVKCTDQRAYECWAFCKDPSRIPQVVYLSLTDFEPEMRSRVHVYFARPRGIKWSHVLKVLVHIDALEDLLFYHYPREELITDGKSPLERFKMEIWAC
jgi:hypothetical protein